MRTFAKLLVTASLLALLAGCGSGANDGAITQEIQSKLYASPDAKSASIEISSKDGVVTLTGTVPSDSVQLEAYKIAADAKGVTKVNDQMTVASAQPAESTPAASAAPAPPVEIPVRPLRPLKPSMPARQLAADNSSQSSVAVPPPPAPVTQQQPPSPPPFVQPTPPPPPVTRTVTVPAGTVLREQMVDSVDSAVNKAGDMFRASLATPITNGGDVVVPAGTDVDVRLVDASSAGRMKGRSGVTLEL